MVVVLLGMPGGAVVPRQLPGGVLRRLLLVVRVEGLVLSEEMLPTATAIPTTTTLRLRLLPIIIINVALVVVVVEVSVLLLALA